MVSRDNEQHNKTHRRFLTTDHMLSKEKLKKKVGHHQAIKVATNTKIISCIFVQKEKKEKKRLCLKYPSAVR